MDIGRTVSKSNNDKCEIKDKINKNYLLHNVCYLQHRVNNLNIEKRKTSFVCFYVKQQNIFGLVLIATGNLVHSAIVWGSSGKP